MVKKSDVLEQEKEFVDVLKMFAPGSSLRTALDDLLRARMGALIVFENSGIHKIIERGFTINVPFSAQKLVELCKMDGAIILSRDGKQIIHANTLLIPNVTISTKETGTRHKAAERAAKQLQTVVVAVSERKNKVTVYYNDVKHELEKSSEILRRAAETLQILEKQRELYNDLITNFNVLELNGFVTSDDVSSVLQRIEIMKRVAETVKRFLIELGKEGIIVSMRLKELMGGLEREESFVLRDYFEKPSEAGRILSGMDLDFLLEAGNISKLIFQEINDKPISPKGVRFLSKTRLVERYIDGLIGKFKNIDGLLGATSPQLLEVLESEEVVNHFLNEVDSLKEKIVLGKKV